MNPAPIANDDDNAARSADSAAIQPAAEDAQILAQRIEQHVARTVGGRIRNLNVAASAGLVTVQGYSTSYYAKQLAQETALALTPSPFRIAIRIEVVQRERGANGADVRGSVISAAHAS
jgi:hypothetical protein